MSKQVALTQLTPGPGVEQVVRILSHAAVGLAFFASLSSPGPHLPWLFAGLLCFVGVIELPRRFERWVLLPGLAGLFALAVGLDLEPRELSLFSYLFHIVTVAAATRMRWPQAIIVTLGAFGFMTAAQHGWLIGGEHRGHDHTLTDLTGLLFLTVLVKVLVDGQRRITHLNHSLERQANTDELTGLLNHRALMERFDDLMLQGMPSLAVVMLDLDQFKRFNDSYGHQVGDEVLRHMGGELARMAPPGAHAGRYGGDEFMVLIPGGDREKATAWAAWFTEQLKLHPLTLPGVGPVCVAASFGVAVGPADGQSRQALHGQADLSLYRAKARRSPTVCEPAG